MIKSNCTNVPPATVAYLMGQFPAIKTTIESFIGAKEVNSNKANKLISELKKFGLNEESIKIL